ncbi:CaiB/BaiF CoA transferase family protein [Roseibium sp.]|uniref:CaiB/BaiF CoA transferase family protein n=1 Tax=Roseibium sp. TaxID=1936156 RepID=UPI003A968C7F
MSKAILDGIRVADFSRVFAVPACAQILADLGAQVIKIEEPERGDEARYYGCNAEELAACGGASPSFHALNRNKQSVGINLALAEGREAARRLISTCDVLLHNFRVGTMEKFGLGYDDLKTDNPGLVYGEFSAYGPVGSLSHIGANDLALQAHSGLLHLTGEADRAPVRVGTAAIDLHAGVALSSAILAALFHRERTGRGQYVETSLLRSSAHLMNYFYSEYWMTGKQRSRMGTANHLSVPNQVFPAEDGYAVIIAPSDQMWERLARALDPDQLLRTEFASILDRQAHRELLVETLSAVTRTWKVDDLVHVLGEAKVNVAKVNSIAEAADHLQLSAIGGVMQQPDAEGGRKAVGSPFTMSRAGEIPFRSAPELGANTRSVFAEAGIAGAEFERLEKAGAFGLAAAQID